MITAPSISETSSLKVCPSTRCALLAGLQLVIASRPLWLQQFSIAPYAGLLLLAGTCLLLDGSRGRLGRATWLAIAFGGWCALSLLWSVLPGDSFIAVVQLTLTILTAAIVASVAPGGSVAYGYFYGCAAIVLATAVLVVFRPDLALVSEAYNFGALRGFYSHRNELGYTLFVGFTAGLFAESRRYLVVRVGAQVLIGLGILWSASSTALIMSIAAVAVALYARVISRISVGSLRAAVRVAIVLVLALAVVLVVLYPEFAAGMVGRNDDLTGRTLIWPYVVWAWSQAIIAGFGWGAVWADDSVIGYVISEHVGFRVYHAHDSYLDVAIQVGLVGLVLLLWMIVLAVLRGLPSLILVVRGARSLGDAYMTVVLILISVYSVVEPRVSYDLGMAILVFCLSSPSYCRTQRPSFKANRRPFDGRRQ